MASSYTIPQGEHVLKDRTDWPFWYAQLCHHAKEHQIWDYIKPDGGKELETPVYPSYEEVHTAGAPSQEEKLYIYKQQLYEYRESMAGIQRLRNWVNLTVSPGFLSPLMLEGETGEHKTLRQLIHDLRTEVAPSRVSTANTVRTKYREHLEAGKQGIMQPRAWYDKWRILYKEAESFKLGEVEGVLAAHDFLSAVAPRLAPEWARNMNDRIIELEIVEGRTLTLHQIGQIFSAKLLQNEINGGVGMYATLGNREDKPVSSSRELFFCPCVEPSPGKHKWRPQECRTLSAALAATNVSDGSRYSKIRARLNDPRYKDLRIQFSKKGWLSSKAKQITGGAAPPAFPGTIQAALLDPQLWPNNTPAIYSTMDFDAHPLSRSTILDNGGACHLVNNKDLLEPGSFQKATRQTCVEAGTQALPISGYGTRRLSKVMNGQRGPNTEDLVLSDVVVVEGFHLNIVSEARLRDKGVWFLGLDCSLRIGTLEQSIVLATLQRHLNLTFVEYKPISFYPTVMSVKPRRSLLRSWSNYPRESSESLWHQRAGHLGPQALRALVERAVNVRIKGTERSKCEFCATTHGKQVISRRPRERPPRPFFRVAWDLFSMPKGRLGELWIMLLKCEYSGKIFVYHLQAKTLTEIMRVFQNFASMLLTKYKLQIAVLRQDNDAATLPWHGKSQFEIWCEDRGVEIEKTPPYTHEPNGGAERAGQEIITKAIKMQSSANLPPKLWPEVIDAATWLYNMSPSHAHELRSPNEELDNWFVQYFRHYQPSEIRRLGVDLRPDWSGVYAYGCRAYPLNKERAAGRHRRSFKIAPRAHIGYLVGYRASNIYRIWVPSLDQVITTRNVTFDEEQFYQSDEEPEIPQRDALKLVHLLHEPGDTRIGGEIFEETLQVSEQSTTRNQASTEQETGRAQLTELENQDCRPGAHSNEESADTRIASSAGKLLRNRVGRRESFGLYTPEPTPEGQQAWEEDHQILGYDDRSSRNVQLPGEESSSQPSGDVHTSANQPTALSSRQPGEARNQRLEAQEQPRRAYNRRDWGEQSRTSRRLRGEPPSGPKKLGRDGRGVYALITAQQSDSAQEQLQSILQGAAKALLQETVRCIIAAAILQPKLHFHNLPPLPLKWKDLQNHPFGDRFKEAAVTELQTLARKGTWVVIERPTSGSKPLPLKWVFTYKLDGEGNLIKCKARICVRGDLQPNDTINSTYAATLAAKSFRMVMAIAAQFDLEVYQYDVVGAFLNASRKGQPPVICELPDGFKESGQVAQLSRALYGLRDSPMLWHREFSDTLTKLGLSSSREEPCLFFDCKRETLVVFYVDDILIISHRDHQKQALEIAQGLKDAYELEDKGAISWFLGVRVTRDRAARTITLSHATYIEKLAKKFNLVETGSFPETPLLTKELEKSESSATKQQIKAYQERIGSILYTAITLRPDVAFAVSQLSHFLTNPSQEHLEAANRLIVYLYRTRNRCIQYGGDHTSNLVMCSDASFADDKETRRSSQGYIILLFGGPILWKAARQDTVTTSTTEAELLALEHVTKESLALKRLFSELTLQLGAPWQIFCDNQQTIRLVVEENCRITTRLRHVDIQNMWLRQEHAKGTFEVLYLKTSEMPADGLTKNLGKQQHNRFISLLNLHDHITGEEHGNKGSKQA